MQWRVDSETRCGQTGGRSRHDERCNSRILVRTPARRSVALVLLTNCTYQIACVPRRPTLLYRHRTTAGRRGRSPAMRLRKRHRPEASKRVAKGGPRTGGTVTTAFRRCHTLIGCKTSPSYACGGDHDDVTRDAFGSCRMHCRMYTI